MTPSAGAMVRKAAVSDLPLVTVFVACYNHERFVVEALDSVRIQSYPRIQLIVADDCSKDDSVAVIRRWLEQHWPDALLITHDRNQGVCRTFNEILRHAKGKYVAGFSADDVWLPRRLGRMVEWLEAQPEEVGMIYSDAYRMDEFGRPLPEMFVAFHRSGEIRREGWMFEELAAGNFIPAMTTLIRRRCFDVVGFYDESLPIEDWDMWLRISRRFRIGYWPEATAKYRVLATSLSHARPAAVKRMGELVLIKCLRQGWLTGKLHREAVKFVYFHARDEYQRRSEHRFRAAWELCREYPRPKHFLLLAFCVARVPAEWHESIMGVARKLKRPPMTA